ncbi:MAG: hypothetical protein QM766_27900 [Burkholderiaceae bacterium]
MRVMVRFQGRDYELDHRPAGLPCTQWLLYYLVDTPSLPGRHEQIVDAAPGHLTLGAALDLMLPRIKARYPGRLASDVWIAPDDEAEPTPVPYPIGGRDPDDPTASSPVVLAPI